MTTNGHPDSIVAGIGCSSAATPAEIIALVDATLAEAGLKRQDLAAVGTHMRRRGNAAIRAVAAHFGVPLRLFEDADLDPARNGVCEGVAAVAGPLRIGKRKSAHATCAIAACPPGFALAGFGQPDRPSAAIASSIVPTSWAGP